MTRETLEPLGEPPTQGRRWGAIHILLVAFVLSLAAHFVLLAIDTAATDMEHGQPFEWGSYLITWGAAVFENLQSEWAQLIVQGLLFSVLGERLFTAATTLEARRHGELLQHITLLRAELGEMRDGRDNPGPVDGG